MDGTFRILWAGIAIGISIAAPVGPIGIICIRRTFVYGKTAGFVSGLGAASADAIYAAIAIYGINYVTASVAGIQGWIEGVGGVLLIYLGIRTLRSFPTMIIHPDTTANLLGDYVSTFLLTLINPLTILSYAAMFAVWNLGSLITSGIQPYFAVAGVFAGSMFWWLFLSQVAGWVRSKSNHQVIIWINRLAGITIISFGIYLLLGIILRYMFGH